MVQDKKGDLIYRDAPKTKKKGDKEADEEVGDGELEDLEMTPSSYSEMPRQYNYSNLAKQ